MNENDKDDTQEKLSLVDIVINIVTKKKEENTCSNL